MGFLSRLFGGAPDAERFAKMMEAELRAAGVSGPIRFDRERFTLHIGTGKTHELYLGNAFAEWQKTPIHQRRGVLQRYARLPAEEQEPPLDEVREMLLPRIRQRVFYHANAFLMSEPGPAPAPFAHRVFSEHLGASAVVDYPDRIQESFQDPRERWGVSMEELLEIGAENLWKRSGQKFQQVIPGCWQSPWRDNHDASRLYLTNLVRTLRVRGDPVAFVPNRDTLLVTGSEDEKGLSLAAAIAEKEYQDNRSISGIAVTLDGNAWNPFATTPDHPATPLLARLRYMTLAADHADQKDALDSWHEKNGIDLFVASYKVFEKDDRLRSVAVWSEGVTALLPVADEVAFVRVGADGKPAVEPVVAAWDRAFDVVGSRMALKDGHPPRYLVESFPTGAELGRLAG